MSKAPPIEGEPTPDGASRYAGTPGQTFTPLSLMPMIENGHKIMAELGRLDATTGNYRADHDVARIAAAIFGVVAGITPPVYRDAVKRGHDFYEAAAIAHEGEQEA